MNVLRGLDCGAMIVGPITGDVICTVGSMFVDDTDLYCWEESLKNGRPTVRENPRGNTCLGNSADRNRRVPEAGEVFLEPA